MNGVVGGPARIRTGDRQVSRTRGYEPAALSVLQPEENLAELRALQENRSLNSILNVLVARNSCFKPLLIDSVTVIAGFFLVSFGPS